MLGVEVIRNIGRHCILVDTAEPISIYLEEKTIKEFVSDIQLPIELSKPKILEILSEGGYIPLTLHWELLDKCNLSYPFCYIVGHSSEKIVRFSEIENHLSDLIEEGLLFCTITGGESTIHPDFKSIYTFLKEHGVVVEVFTNGYNIDDELMDIFKLLPPSSIEVSVYSLSNKVLVEKYGASHTSTGERILENIVKMKDKGINVACKTFLNTVTVSEVENVTSWCKDNNIKHYSSNEITNAYDGVDLRYYEVLEVNTSYKKPNQSICLPCNTRYYGSAIDASFSIFPCASIRLKDCMFDIRDIGVSESINRLKKFINKFQDTKIINSSNGKSNCATCMAYAQPVRDSNGDILYFSQP